MVWFASTPYPPPHPGCQWPLGLLLHWWLLWSEVVGWRTCISMYIHMSTLARGVSQRYTIDFHVLKNTHMNVYTCTNKSIQWNVLPLRNCRKQKSGLRSLRLNMKAFWPNICVSCCWWFRNLAPRGYIWGTLSKSRDQIHIWVILLEVRQHFQCAKIFRPLLESTSLSKPLFTTERTIGQPGCEILLIEEIR